MSSVFAVTSLEIQQLNDQQARELVARLCKAELRLRGVGTAAVTWGGDQRAADGGTDVRVAALNPNEISGYIPKNNSVFQIKAEVFPSNKIQKEMAPNGVLRLSIQALSESAGAYVIVSTKDNCSDTSLKNRVKAMSDCLTGSGLQDLVHYEFYDSTRIADWAENHPSVLVWLRNILRKPLQGWKPYGAWAYREKSVDDKYLFDEKIKVVIPNSNEAIPIVQALDRLREGLAVPEKSVRIVGLSGVGKTRLVQALFDERIKTTAACLNSENVVYTDLSDDPVPTPLIMVESLLDQRADCIIVVDNCAQALHGRLTELVQRGDSKLRLVTVEYDIQDDLPEGTSCYRLDGSSPEVISSLLRRRYDELSDLDINHIVSFSDGNARIAFALASTSEKKGQLAQLRDEQLFRRLFLQKQSESNELQRCAEAASLLYSFDVSDESDSSELSTLAAIAAVSIPIFQHYVAELMRRGLVQQRGQWRAVLPHAISNRLASRNMEVRPAKIFIEKLVSGPSIRVAESFSRRLGMLHESEIASAIAKELVKPDGILGDVAALTESGRKILENVAPLVQRAVLDNLLAKTADDQFTSVKYPHRTRYARLLRSLAYDAELFDAASLGLLRYSLAEDECHRFDSVQDILQSLFFARLSGTMAKTEQRAAFIRSLAESGDLIRQKIALKLLKAALQTDHFSSNYSFDFGALRRTYGWHPKCQHDVREWYKKFLQLATVLAKSQTPVALEARSLIANSIRGLWGDEVMNASLTEIARELRDVDGWPEGWIAVRNALYWDKDLHENWLLDQLRALEGMLAPRNLSEQIHFKVLTRGLFSADDFDNEELAALSYSQREEQVSREARTLGEAAAADDSIWIGLMPRILESGRTNKPYHFGIGVATTIIFFEDFMSRAKKVLTDQPDQPRDLLFIIGLLAGRLEVQPLEVSAFLDAAVSDPIWGRYFPRLQLGIKLDDAGFRRLSESIRLRAAPSYEYKNLELGRRTETLSPSQIAALMSALAELPDGGLAVAIDVLYMIVYNKDDRDPEFRHDLQPYLAQFFLLLDWDKLNLSINDNLSHLEEVIEFSLSNGDPYCITIPVLTRLIEQQYVTKRFLALQLGQIFRPFFKENAVAALDLVYTHMDDRFMPRLLAVSAERLGESALTVISEATWLDWCDRSDEKFRFAAEGCQFFTQAVSVDEQVLSVSPIAIAIFRHATNRREIIDTLLQRLVPNHWSGSRAVMMKDRLSLLDEFDPGNDLEIAQLLNDARLSFGRLILQEEAREAFIYQTEARTFE